MAYLVLSRLVNKEHLGLYHNLWMILGQFWVFASSFLDGFFIGPHRRAYGRERDESVTRKGVRKGFLAWHYFVCQH